MFAAITGDIPDHFQGDFRQRAKAGVELNLTVRIEDYQRQSVPGVKTIVFGSKARLSGLWVVSPSSVSCYLTLTNSKR